MYREWQSPQSKRKVEEVKEELKLEKKMDSRQRPVVLTLVQAGITWAHSEVQL